MKFKHQITPAKEALFAGQSAYKNGDQGQAKAKFDEALELAVKDGDANTIYGIYCALVELHWRQGYESAKKIRAEGLHNRDLRQTQDYALAVVDMLKEGLPTFRFTSCEPIDRLCLLYKLTGQLEQAATLLGELEALGFGHLQQVQSWRFELAKLQGK